MAYAYHISFTNTRKMLLTTLPKQHNCPSSKCNIWTQQFVTSSQQLSTQASNKKAVRSAGSTGNTGWCSYMFPFGCPRQGSAARVVSGWAAGRGAGTPCWHGTGCLCREDGPWRPARRSCWRTYNRVDSVNNGTTNVYGYCQCYWH